MEKHFFNEIWNNSNSLELDTDSSGSKDFGTLFKSLRIHGTQFGNFFKIL